MNIRSTIFRANALCSPRALALLAVALLTACGGGGGASESSGAAADSVPEAPAATTAAVECGGTGFPCSLGAVSAAVLERGESLADAVMARLDQGQPMAEVLAFLRAEPGLADAANSPAALRFRLEGGRDVFIFAPRAGASAALTAPVTAAPAAVPRAQPDRKAAHVVVGGGASVKRALVLSPFKHQFGSDDDGAPVAQLLAATRGYAGQVTYLENATPTAAKVGIQQYAGWEQYDVVHIATHGGQVCDATRCVSVILSGDSYSTAAELLQLTEAGINTARLRGHDEKFLAIGPEFFRTRYPAGLDRKIIFFNACQSYGAAGSGLSDVLLGTGSVFLGWTEIVESPAAKQAAIALYTQLSTHGITVDRALDAIGSLGFNKHPQDGAEVNAILLLDRAIPADLRLREVVTLEHPATGGTLHTTSRVRADGKAQDGSVDGVPYQVLIEGIPENQQDSAIVTFRVNGHASTPQAVTIGERVGATGWRLRGQVPYIDVQDEQTVEMIATVELPEGGSSEHRVSVKLVADEPGVAETWVGESVSHFDDDTPQGRIHITQIATVVFKQAAASVGGRYKVLRSTTGSTMRWTRSGTIKTLLDGDCAYASDTVEVPIAEGDGEIIIDTAAAPGSYTYSGYTAGPTVRLAENCGNYQFSTRAGGAWGPALATSDGYRVDPSGTGLEGVHSQNLLRWEWTFRRQ